MNLRSELARLRRLIEEKVAAKQRGEVYRYVTVLEGEPLTSEQEEALAHNRSLKHPTAVGFSCIVIAPQPEQRLKAPPIANEFEN